MTRNSGRLTFLLLAIIWTAAITNFSRDTFSSAHTAPYIETLLRWLLPFARAQTIHTIHVVIRKLGHLTEYGILAGLLFGIWAAPGAPREAAKTSRWRMRWCAYTLAIVAMLALLDEYHQSFTRQRVASLNDCLIDIMGGALALLLIRFTAWEKFNDDMG